MTRSRSRTAAAAPPSAPRARPTPAPPAPVPEPERPPVTYDDAFGPIPLRYRHDGWVPRRQLAFIEALAECGCVETAAKSVGMSRAAAYALKRRADAQAFRLAWDAAMDSAVSRLADAALARAIHGVPVPVFHAGEQVGERRVFNERLTMFLLRARDPARYGKWIEGKRIDERQDGGAAVLSFRIGRMVAAAVRVFQAAMSGRPAPEPLPEPLVGDRRPRRDVIDPDDLDDEDLGGDLDDEDLDEDPEDAALDDE